MKLRITAIMLNGGFYNLFEIEIEIEIEIGACNNTPTTLTSHISYMLCRVRNRGRNLFLTRPLL